MRRLWGFESQSMWEEPWETNGGRDFRVIEVDGARPIFDYVRSRPLPQAAECADIFHAHVGACVYVT